MMKNLFLLVVLCSFMVGILGSNVHKAKCNNCDKDNKCDQVVVGTLCFDEKGKDKLYKEYITRFLADIAANGLPIGNRWLIKQEGQFLVIRDIKFPGKDFRYAFSPSTYKDL